VDVNVSHILTVVLLAVGAGAALLSAMGILVVRDFYERLHYVGPAGSVGAVAIAAALVLKESFSAAGIKVILVAILLVVSNSVLTHATARAGRINQLGDWKPQEGENIAKEETSNSVSSRALKKKSRHSHHKQSKK
jgi:multicomponent Na+:H+ antiporter subunit G